MHGRTETVTVVHGSLGRVVIDKADFDPARHELWGQESQAAMTEGSFKALSYVDQKAFAALYGVTGNGEAALVEKLRAAEIF